MIKLKTIRRLLRIWRQRPMIVVSEYGQATEMNHCVSVGLHSLGGMMGTGLDFPADEMGHAKAESYARTMHNITGLPVLDSRERSRPNGRPATHMRGTD